MMLTAKTADAKAWFMLQQALFAVATGKTVVYMSLDPKRTVIGSAHDK